MTIQIPGISSAGGNAHVGGAEGAPLLADIDNGHYGIWVPTAQPVGEVFDTLARFDPANEPSILADGGVAHGERLVYADASAVRATLTAGWYGASAQATSPNGIVVYPLGGLLAKDEATINCAVNPGAAALSTLSNVTIWKAVAGNAQTFTLSSHLTTVTASYTMDGHTVSVSLTINSTDVPASAWTRIAVIWDASAGTVRIILGDNAKTAVTGSPTANPTWNVRPWEADPRLGDQGFIIGHNVTQGGTPTGIKVSDVEPLRYKRTYGEQGFRPKPGISINVGSVQGAWNNRLGGVVGHYTGWADNEAGESGFSTVRAAQLDALQTAGCKLVRIAEHHKRAVPTVSGGAITGIDFSGLDAHWDRFYSRGFKVHAMAGYVPQAFNGSTNSQLPPTAAATGAVNEAAAFALYANYISQVFARLKARYPGMIESISFFNEPSIGWGGTLSQFKALWAAVATRHAADNPELPALGGPDEVGVSTYTTGVMDQAVASGVPLGSALVHYYDPMSLTGLWETVDGLQDAAVARSLTPLYGVPEWGQINPASSGYTGKAILAQEAPNRQNGVWMAAYVHASLYEMSAMGVNFATFFRPGQQATFNASSGGEEMMALLSNSARPRAWPAFGALSLFWKHNGTRIAAAANWPGIRAFGSLSGDGTITVSYSSFRAYQAQRTQEVQLAWAGLPSTFTWKEWRLDHRDEEGGRPILLGKGDQADIPTRVELAGLGVGGIEIAP